MNDSINAQMLRAGDMIFCHDKDDMVRTMNNLARLGIQTGFVYEYQGKKVLALEVKEDEDGNC